MALFVMFKSYICYMNALQQKKILIGISGSIAAYKIILLVRLLVKAGAEVRVIMTKDASNFVSPLVLSTFTKEKVLVDLFDDNGWSDHVHLGRWADLFLIAPATCNTIAKMAMGHCDNLLLAVYLSATCPVWLAPAMDAEMWHHPAIQRNLECLRADGVQVLKVHKGELGSGLIGEGRMEEPEVIFWQMVADLRTHVLDGQRIMITAGPTYESIDPVRFIGNHSSGKMGFELAKAAYLAGAEVTLITGPTSETLPFEGIRRIDIQSAADLFAAAKTAFAQSTISIFAAAVADFHCDVVATDKIKKNGDADMTLHLVQNIDILKTLAASKTEHQIVVGFALETQNELENAQKKLHTKNADFIVLNSLRNPDAGFGVNTNQVTILSKDGNSIVSELASKSQIAEFILTTISQNILKS